MNKHKYKRSRQRERILHLLQNTKSHPTANIIYDQLREDFKNLSMGTVYRNLNILIDQGLVQKIESGTRFDRFDANVNQHYHFICRGCGAVDDLPVDKLPDLNDLVNQTTEYQADQHRLDFFGVCPSCAE